MSECTANVSVLLFNKHSKTIVGNYTVAQDSNMYKNCLLLFDSSVKTVQYTYCMCVAHF